MNRTDRLVGEVVDVAALGASAFVGWWKLVAKVVVGFVVITLLNVVIQRFYFGDVGPHAGEDFFWGANIIWFLWCAMTGLMRGARNLFRHGA
jgi:hypothetical protein